MHTFDEPLPDAASGEELKLHNKKFLVEDALRWVENTDNIAGRFMVFNTFDGDSEFYQEVAEPLLSMRAVQYIDAERRIKQLKHNIVTKKHNRLKDPKGEFFLRASENLKHIMRAKKILGKKITDSLKYIDNSLKGEKYYYTQGVLDHI